MAAWAWGQPMVPCGWAPAREEGCGHVLALQLSAVAARASRKPEACVASARQHRAWQQHCGTCTHRCRPIRRAVCSLWALHGAANECHLGMPIL